MQYGYFDDKNKEYVITRPDTPTPWINYLGLDEYCAIISNTAGGYSFHKDPRDRRITRYRYNNLPQDRPGRYIYLRDNLTKEYWSATWQPTNKNLKEYRYECRHGLGYTKINSGYRGIETTLTYFVPLKENLEVWSLRVKNATNKRRKLSLFTYIEFCLWQAIMDMQDFQYSLNISKAECIQNTIYHLTYYYPKAGFKTFAYFSSNKRISGFDTDREAFIGKYRDESNPLAVERGISFNSRNYGGNPIGSHNLKLTLRPQQEEELVFILGVDEDKPKAQEKINKYKDPKYALKKLQELKEGWETALSNLEVQTPDREFNRMINVWNQYQCRITFNWARSASFYESGIGRGIGFRDSNQDCLGALHVIPSSVNIRIIDLAKNQFKRGNSFHQYFPLTKAGDKSGYSDDHLWLIVSTTNYIKETGDFGFLKARVPFADGGAATLYEHLIRAVEYSFKNCGRHGIPLLGYADWNDCLNNLGKEAESVWVAQFLCYATKELAVLAKLIRKEKDCSRLNKLYQKMRRIINRCAWDGSWYIRIFDHKSRPVGSKKCKEGGKIYLNTQSWAVLSEIADNPKALKCMDAVKKNLATEHGIKLLAPAYKTFYPYIGAIGTFAPGLKENAGIFCHANPWAVIAETKLGRGNLAFSYYKRILPAARNAIAHIQKTEPYVYSQFIASDESPEFGRSRNSWLTGSASWNLVAASSYILGIRPDYKGLAIDPCIPKKWTYFKVKRFFRGAIYHIEVRNPEHVSSGIKAIAVDGKNISGNILPLFKPGTSHQVKVIMGKKGLNAR